MTDPLEMLKVSVTNHQMTVLRDDGLYRHIRFQEPGTAIWHWDLVTWPGHLVITGDLQDFHFARTTDMFEFFRNPVGYINPGYWAEKLRGPVRTKSYSSELFKQRIVDYFRDYCSYTSGPHLPLWQAIRSEILDNADTYDDSTAHAAVYDFSFRSGGYFYADVKKDSPPPSSFQFVDSWEWDLTDYDFHFLVSLHAIVWGINQYDAAHVGVS